MPEINLIDSSLKNYYDNAEISIQVSLDGFSFCVNSCGDNIVRAFRHYNFSETLLLEDLLNHTDDILHKDELLRLPYTKSRVIFQNRKSTIIPSEFVEKEKLKKILEFNQPIDELDEVHHNALDCCDACMVFAIPTYFAGMITDKLKHVNFYHQATPLLQNSFTHQEDFQKTTIFLQLNREFFDLLIIDENRLKLCNSFPYVDATDLLYFVLYACKQLHINLRESNAFLLGDYAREVKLTQDIRSYIPALSDIEPSKSIQVADGLRSLDRVRFYALLNLMLCE